MNILTSLLYLRINTWEKKKNLGAGSLGNEIKIQMPCNFIDFPELSDFNSQLQCVCMTLSKTS